MRAGPRRRSVRLGRRTTERGTVPPPRHIHILVGRFPLTKIILDTSSNQIQGRRTGIFFVATQHHQLNCFNPVRNLEVGSWQLEVDDVHVCICSGGRKDNKQSPPILQKRAMTAAHEGSVLDCTGIGDRLLLFVICECRLYYLRREEISAWDSRIRKYEYYHHEERAARARGAAERLEGTYVVCRRRQSEDGGASPLKTGDK